MTEALYPRSRHAVCQSGLYSVHDDVRYAGYVATSTGEAAALSICASTRPADHSLRVR